MAKLSKRIKEARKVTDLNQAYPLKEAVELLSKMPPVRFDETVELSVYLGVDPKQSTQMVRGIINLPHGSGKKVCVLVFTENAEEAIQAGADHAGLEDMIKKVKDGWVDFDVALATPEAMKSVRTVARVLGPRGLMPNPKSGTVTNDVAALIKEIKQGGRVEYKMDKTANVGIVVGKRSFESDKLRENIEAAIESLSKVRPEGLKGRYVENMSISSTMSPGIQLEEAIYAKC